MGASGFVGEDWRASLSQVQGRRCARDQGFCPGLEPAATSPAPKVARELCPAHRAEGLVRAVVASVEQAGVHRRR